MKRILRRLTPVLRPLILWYLSKKRKYSYKGITLTIYPGVFHPGLFFSTKMLLQFLDKQELKGIRILELGAGSGLISMFCCLKKQAHVTASDINPVAVQALVENAAHNNATINVVQSDLFDNLDPSVFDRIIINPPYYPRTPVTDADAAWYCGEDFQYFRKLFLQLDDRGNPSSIVYMILSEDCAIDKIKSIGEEKSFKWELVAEKKIYGETNYIFKIFR